MAYTKQHIGVLILALGALLAVSSVFFFISDAYDPETVQGFDAPTVPISASPGKPLRLPLQYSEKPVSGIVIYAANEETAHMNLRADILDSKGNILAKKVRQKTIYKKSGAPELQLFFTENTYDKKQPGVVSIEPYGNTAASFIANDMRDGQEKPAIVFSMLFKKPVTPETKQGVLIGASLALALVLLYVINVSGKWQWVSAAGILCIFSFLVSLPYLYQPNSIGIHDWDYRHSLSHIYQETIRTYHQVPYWNPYICGGTAGLGDPEFALFTPSFLLQFIFGVKLGTGIGLSLSLAITALGMLQLARSLRLGVFPSLTSAIVVTFSSALLLKATEAHVTIIYAYMWIPWALWAWYKAYQTAYQRWVIICAAFLALSLLQGGIYILSYTAVALALVCLLSSKKMHAIRISAYIGAWFLGMVSFQLIPSLLWVKEFPDKAFVGSAFTYANIWDIFFGRYLPHVFIVPNQVSRWHEYGAYIGYGVFSLAIIGISYIKTSRVVRILVLGIVLTLIISSLGPLFESTLEQLRFLPRSNISRLVLFTLLCVGLLAGFGMKRLMSVTPSLYSLIPIIVIGYIAIDLMSIAYPIANEAFTLPFPQEHLEKSPYPITHITERYEIRHEGSDIPRTYGAVLQGYGTSTFCSVIGPDSAVVTTSPGDEPPAYLWSAQTSELALTSWTPNTIEFSYSANTPSAIFVNTNNAMGWKSTIGTVMHANKTLSVEVPPGTNIVTLEYSPPGMKLGLLLTLTTFTILGIKLMFARLPRSN